MLAMSHAIVPFVQHIFPVFMTSLKDEDDEVRSNTTYGLGILAFYGGDLITPYPHVYFWYKFYWITQSKCLPFISKRNVNIFQINFRPEEVLKAVNSILRRLSKTTCNDKAVGRLFS